jgi:hypothetical protein
MAELGHCHAHADRAGRGQEQQSALRHPVQPACVDGIADEFEQQRPLRWVERKRRGQHRQRQHDQRQGESAGAGKDRLALLDDCEKADQPARRQHRHETHHASADECRHRQVAAELSLEGQCQDEARKQEEQVDEKIPARNRRGEPAQIGVKQHHADRRKAAEAIQQRETPGVSFDHVMAPAHEAGLRERSKRPVSKVEAKVCVAAMSGI